MSSHYRIGGAGNESSRAGIVLDYPIGFKAMPILFKCECGAPGMVSEEYAGKQYTCRSCGHSGIIPEHSAEDCVLVYRSGFPNEGMVLDKEEFWNELVAGNYHPNDLIYHEDAWKPLRMVYEMPELPPPQESSDPDIALRLSELPPMPGFEKQGSIHPMQILSRHVRNAVEWLKRKRSTKHKTVGQKAVYYILVLFILVLGYFCGLGRLINYVRWRPAYVLVVNPDNERYKVVLGGEERDLMPNSRAVFQDIFVSTSSHKLVKLLKENGELAYSVKVPIRPGLDVMVSPGDKLTFGSFSPEKAKEVKFNGKLLLDLASELSQNKAPETLLKIGNELLECVKKVRNEDVRGQVFTSKRYSFNYCGMMRSTDYSDRMRSKEKVETVAKPELVCDSISFTFGVCRVNYHVDPKKSGYNLTVDIRQPFIPVNATEAAKQKKGLTLSPISGKLTFDIVPDEKGVLKITTNTPLAGKAMVNKLEFNGQWRYTTALKPNEKAWQWSWSYEGMHSPKYKKGKPQYLKINLTHGFDNKEKLTVK